MKFVTAGIAALMALFAATAAAADADTFTLGKNYDLVSEASPPTDPKKVLVQEFFWYGCPHCYAFEPYLNAWAKKRPSWVDFEHVPNSLGREAGVLHEHAYYAAEILGIEDKIRQPMFDGLKHVEEGDPALTTPADIDALFTQAAGVKPGSFSELNDSFAVEGKVRRADQLAIGYGITGTPSIVVDGRWVADESRAGGPDRLIKLIDFLCEKARAERGIPAPKK